MGQLQKSLAELLDGLGSTSRKAIPYPRLGDVLESQIYAEVDRVYRKLGGVLQQFELNLRAWDIEFEGIAVELDEQLHFNRYRLATLDSPAYAHLPGFPLAAYQEHCEKHESECLSAGGFGGKWTSRSTVRQFGKGASPRDLSGQGSPRWRQRAFYDFVKDLSPRLIGVQVVRVSIWDTVPEDGQVRRVLDVLRSPHEGSAAGLGKLIAGRVR